MSGVIGTDEGPGEDQLKALHAITESTYNCIVYRSLDPPSNKAYAPFIFSVFLINIL